MPSLSLALLICAIPVHVTKPVSASVTASTKLVIELFGYDHDSRLHSRLVQEPFCQYLGLRGDPLRCPVLSSNSSSSRIGTTSSIKRRRLSRTSSCVKPAQRTSTLATSNGTCSYSSRSCRATDAGPPTMKLIGWAHRSWGRSGSTVSAGIFPSCRNRRQMVLNACSARANADSSSGPTKTGRLAAISPVPPAAR
jgi:hypothetical protein